MKVNIYHFGLALPLLGVGLLAGCGAESSDAEGTYYPGDQSGYATATPANPDDGNSSDDDGLPQEEPDSFYRAAPAVTEEFVYVVNPDRDTLSKISAETQAVYTLAVGAHPTQVLIGRGSTLRAVVLNEADATLSILDTETDAVTTVPIHKDTNFMSLRGDGQFAITHFSDHVEGAADDINGVRSYSSISVVYTGETGSESTSTPITVGLNPRSVTFIDGEDRAMVLCDDAVALIELSATPTSKLIPLTEDPDDSVNIREIKISPDGHYAYFRTGEAKLLVVDLDNPDSPYAVSELTLEGVPTDMELTADHLILVDRGNQQLVVYNPTNPFGEPEYFDTPENQIVGSVAVAPESGKAILYTTLTEADISGTAVQNTPLNRFSVWDLDTGDIRLKELVKPVEAVTLNHNPDLPVAVFVHNGETASEQPAFSGEEAFSQYYFDDGLVVPALLEAPTKAIADSSDGRFAFMILEEALSVVVIDFQTRQMSGVSLQSEPVFVGILTGTDTGYVSQQHELGRLSFIDPFDLSVSTITGFELNSQL